MWRCSVTCLRVCLCVCICVCVSLQSTWREGESTKGATITPHCPAPNPPGRGTLSAAVINTSTSADIFPCTLILVPPSEGIISGLIVSKMWTEPVAHRSEGCSHYSGDREDEKTFTFTNSIITFFLRDEMIHFSNFFQKFKGENHKQVAVRLESQAKYFCSCSIMDFIKLKWS